MDDLRQAYATALQEAFDQQIVAEMICCEPVNPAHQLCVQGELIRQEVRDLLADEEVGERSPVIDALMSVRDVVLEVAEQRADGYDAVLASVRRQLLAARMDASGLRREAAALVGQRDCALASHRLQQQMTTLQADKREQAESTVARAENLRDKWLAWPADDLHHAAGLMLAAYLDGTAYGSDEPRPAALDGEVSDAQA